MDLQFAIRVIVAALAAVGIEEFVKNFFKPKSTVWYAVLMLPLAVGSFCAAWLLPLWVIGSFLTVGCVQLCYQTLVQGFKKIIEHFMGKLKSSVDDFKASDMGAGGVGNYGKMDLCEFINRYVKSKVDFDGAFGAQCVDVFRQYCRDVLRIPHTGAVEGAKDLWLKYDSLPKERENFLKATDGIRYGDVLIWNGTPSNKYGHVALAVSLLDGGNVLVFEQDGFKQDGAKFAVRSVNNVLGVLRARVA